MLASVSVRSFMRHALVICQSRKYRFHEVVFALDLLSRNPIPNETGSSTTNNLHLLKVSDRNLPTCVDDYLSLLQTYQMEFDAENPMGRLPGSLVREFGGTLFEYVMLRDPNHNEFEVRVVKKTDGLFFGEGWISMKDVYNLCFGGWVTLAYLSPRLLTIRLLTRWGVEVTYPSYDPPLRHLLARGGPNCCIGASVLSWCLPGSSRPRSLVRSYVKEMTRHEMQAGNLILPWYGFGQSAFAFVFSDLILVDNAANQYKCTLEFGADDSGELVCKVSGGWADLCTTHSVKKGDRIKCSIARYSASNVMFVSVHPRILVDNWLSL